MRFIMLLCCICVCIERRVWEIVLRSRWMDLGKECIWYMFFGWLVKSNLS